MRAFLASGPEGSRFAGVRLRVFGIRPEAAEGLEEDELWVSLQSVQPDGRVLAEDPLHVEVMTSAELDEAMALSSAQGWKVTPCAWTAARLDTLRARREASRVPLKQARGQA